MTKTIKVKMLVPNEDGVREEKEVSVKIAQQRPTANKIHKIGSYDHRLKITAPVTGYIHSFLLEKKVDTGSLKKGLEDFTDLKKSVSGYELQNVTSRLNYLYDVFEHLHNLQKEAKQKRIWIVFQSTPICEVSSSWNRAKTGTRLSSSLQFVVGYKSRKSRRIWDVNGLDINSRQEEAIHEAPSVEWTQEREDQIQAFAERLDGINSNLAAFLLSIDDNNISELLSGNTLLLG